MNILKEILLKYRIAIILGTVAVCISIAFGFLNYNNDKRDVIKRKYSELLAITDYKMDMIAAWLKERSNDIRMMGNSPVTVSDVKELLQNPANNQIRERLNDRFERIKLNYGYQGLVVFDESGEILLSSNALEKINGELLKKAALIDSTKPFRFTTIYQDRESLDYHLDIIASLDLIHNGKKVYIVFRTDPSLHLFPILTKWPSESQTGESFIAETDGDSIVFLSPLKYVENAVLTFKVDNKLDNRPVVKGSKGFEGNFEGLDYRGKEVLSVIKNIDTTNWILIAKVDVEEVVANIAKDTVLLSSIIGLSLMTLFISLGYYFSSKNSRYLGTILEAEQELAKLGQEFKTIFYSIGDGVITTDPDGKIRQMNQIAEQLTGWSLDSVRGENIETVFHTLDDATRHHAKNPVEEVIKTGDVVKSVEYTLLNTKTGEEIPISHSASPIHNLETGEVTGVVLVFKDRTEIRNREKQLALSEEKFSKAFYTSPDAIMITELVTSRIVDYNQGLLDITGHTDDEVAGNTALNLRLLPTQEYRNKLAEHIKSKGAANNIQIEFIHKDGTTKYGLLSASIIEVEGMKYFISITRDITERVKLEQELMVAKDRAEESYRAKSSFFANMSHELRTPLHGVMGFTEVLKDMVTDEEILSVVESIHRSGVRLMGTLNLILDLARVESGKEEIEEEKMLLAKVVKEDFESFRAFAEGKGLAFKIINSDPEAGVIADRRLLDSIVNNLVNNAIKFTHKGEVKIETGTIEVDGKKSAFIRVSDTGIGISEDAQNLIFDEFRQVSEGYDRQIEGTGLGLSIVKKYIDILGGNIEVQSRLGSGTVFTITLPWCEIENESKTLPVEEINAVKDEKITTRDGKKKILFVEDDDASIWFTTKVLESDYDIETYRSAEKALAQLESKEYDAFLLDINLGRGISGIDFVQKIKDNPKYSRIPKVAITAYAMSGQEDIFIKHGFSHYLAKPFSKAELKEFVDSVFSHDSGDQN